MPLTKEEIRERNKEKVLLAALDCIKEQGIQGTKVFSIAKKAGVTTRSVQRYYGERQNLLTEAIVYLMDKKYTVTKEAFETFRNSQKRGIELAEEFFNIQIEYFKREHVDYLMMVEIEIYFYRNGVEHKNFQKHIKHMEYIGQLLKEIIVIGQKDGSIKQNISDTEVAYLAQLVIVGIMRRFSILYKNDDQLQTPVDAIQQLQLTKEILLSYIKN